MGKGKEEFDFLKTIIVIMRIVQCALSLGAYIPSAIIHFGAEPSQFESSFYISLCGFLFPLVMSIAYLLIAPENTLGEGMMCMVLSLGFFINASMNAPNFEMFKNLKTTKSVCCQVAIIFEFFAAFAFLIGAIFLILNSRKQ